MITSNKMNQSINIHIRAILLMALMMLLPSAMWADKEAYAQYADGTLTFRYDENRQSFKVTYALPTSGNDPGWWSYYKEITKVVFDESFKDARPVNLGKWFIRECNLTEITNIEYLNTSEATDMSSMFSGCTSLTSLDLRTFNTENVTKMASMFFDCSALTSLDVTSFNTQKVEDMTSMFSNCLALSELNLPSFDTPNVTNMTGMFAHDVSLSSIKVTSRFAMDQVASSDNMFFDCSKLPGFNSNYTDKTNASSYLTYLTPQPWAEFQKDTRTLTFRYDAMKDYVTATAKYDLPTSGDPGWLENWTYIKNVVFSEAFKDARPVSCAKWFYKMKSLASITGLEYLNTSEVTDMNHMFCESSSLTSLDLSTFSTASVTSMASMFYGCTALKELNLSSFNTQKVEDMSFMFSSCKKLTELDLTAFDTQKVTNMKSMFQFDEVLEHIYVTDLFVLDQVTNSEEMFYYCSSLPSFDKSFTDKTKAPDYLTYIAAQPWVEYQDATQTLTFRNDNTRKAATATGKYDLPAAGVAPGWIAHYEGITKAVINKEFKDVRPERCTKWFYGMSNLTEIQGLEYLCTDSANDMSQMFYHCEKLTTIDLSHFNTERVTTMTGMFHFCFALTQLDLSTFNTEKVDDMSYMFGFCNNLTSLDLTAFDTRTVNNMTGMFAGDQVLTHICVSSSFILDQVTQSTSMFYYCLKLPNFDSNYIDKTKAKDYLTYLTDLTDIKLWVEYQDATKTLTFRYDLMKDYVTATAKYDLPASGVEPGWLEHKGDITKVVFRESFKDARPERSTKWFYGMENLTEIQGLEYLCTDSVNDMSNMFNKCSSLTSLDVSHFNTERVTTMTCMFSECKSLKALDVTSFNTAKVDDMTFMFNECSNLTELDLSSFDTREVINMFKMFYYDKNLEHIYVTDLFDVNKVRQSAVMFYYCEKLSNYDENNLTQDKAHYRESEGGYLTLRRKITVGDKQYNVDGYDSPTCYTDVTFTDGEAYSAPCDFTFSSDKTASYSRTTSNHWATLCLPFAFSADNSTARFYSVKSYTDGNIAVTALTGEIAAGTPVLAYITDGELSVTATAAAAVAEAKQLSELKGAFQQTEVGDEDYIIANDHFWNAGWLKENNGDVKNVYVAPYRASLTLNLTAGAKPNSISISECETDGIDSIDTTDPSAFLEGAELYDLQGRRLTAPISGMMIIRKGGVSRKVIIKGSQAPQGL